MAITWKTYQKHRSIWNSTVAQITRKQAPENYFKTRAVQFDSSLLTSKSHGYLFWGGKGVNTQQFYLDVAQELISIADKWCSDAEAYMQSHHKWHNRTYAAEGGLTAEVVGMENDSIDIRLYHSVPYGVYLETRIFPHAGNLEIIRPTLQAFAPKIMFDMQNLLDRM